MTTPIKPLGPPPTPTPQRPHPVETPEEREPVTPAAEASESRREVDVIKIIDETWEQFEEAYRYLGR